MKLRQVAYLATPENLELPEFILPNVELKFSSDSETHMKDYEVLIEELKDNVKIRIKAEEEVQELRNEIEKLKGQRQSRPNSDLQSFKTVNAVSDSDSWSQSDKGFSRGKAGIRSKIPIRSNRNISPSDTDNGDEPNGGKKQKLQAMVIQLNSRLVAQQEKAAHEMLTLQRQLELSENNVKLLKEEKTRLTSQLSIIKEDLDKNIASVMEEMDSVVEKNRELAEKVRDLKSGQEEMNVNELRLAKEKNELKSKVSDLMKELEVVQGHYKDILAEVQLQDEKTEHHQKEIKALVEQKLLLEKIIEQHQSDEKRAQEQIHFLKNENYRITAATSHCLQCGKQDLTCSNENNKDEHEIAPCSRQQRQPLGEIQNNKMGVISLEAKHLSQTSSGCGCLSRIEELERLLKETRTMYDEAQEKIRVEKEHKEKNLMNAKVQLKKTKSVLKHTV